MYLRFKAHGYIIKEIGIIQPESRYLMSGIAVSIKSDLRYCASGMAVQNCPEYSNGINNLVFLDESGVNTSMTGHYARSKTNEGTVDSIPVNTPCNNLLDCYKLGKNLSTVYQNTWRCNSDAVV